MSRRRVFETKVECPEVTDLGVAANKHPVIGRAVTIEKSGSTSNIVVCLDGAVLGNLDNIVGPQIASALDRGQLFTAVVKTAYKNSTDAFGTLCLKVEYLLDNGQPAITIPIAPRPICKRAAKSFFTKIAGVTFEGRQHVVARCSVGERLILVRDPENQFDKGAIKVMRSSGEQLGFIPAHVSRGDDSSGLAFQMDRGQKYQCRITNLTGESGKTLGVNIELTDAEDFDGPLSTGKQPRQLTVTPAYQLRITRSGVHIEPIEADDRNGALSPVKTPTLRSLAPVHDRRRWLWFVAVAVAVLVLLVALIAHNSF